MQYLPNDPVRLTDDKTAILAIDQRALPSETKYLELRNAAAVAEAIRTLAVRGAPCIGICAAYGVYVAACAHMQEEKNTFSAHLDADAAVIASARPTAVNLSWAVNRMLQCKGRHLAESPAEITEALRTEAETIHAEDIDMCRRIAENGLRLLPEGSRVITHCNAGALATSRYGTGLGPLLLGAERGMTFHAFVDETRPLLQGARLTAYELHRAGIDTTLMCDNMASYLMAQGGITACMVGCDRVAANGDTANKIGTSGLAVLAQHYGVPFYVFCPSPTIDRSCKTGADIRIEQREGDEITHLHFAKPVAPAGIRCLNPAFDITPASLITAIITETGILYPPFAF
ncbi:MAG: S-methyl-5-thioribose-1-phosphate isomerase [Oscillospiraceae bacterium]|nr:S-methyl-5-thioribose-1-phosphate isomerase [Oscillospiraceae bacterium]